VVPLSSEPYSHILLLIGRLIPDNLKSLSIERHIRMCIVQNGLQLGHDHRVQVGIPFFTKPKLCYQIMNIELSKYCRFSRRGHKSSRKMVKITLNPKAVWS
jgi:hypothetical protein